MAVNERGFESDGLQRSTTPSFIVWSDGKLIGRGVQYVICKDFVRVLVGVGPVNGRKLLGFSAIITHCISL